MAPLLSLLDLSRRTSPQHLEDRMQFLSARLRGPTTAVAAALLLSACGVDDVAGPSPSGELRLVGDEVVPPKTVTVCKIGPAGTTATFDVTTSSAFGTVTTPLTLQSTTLLSPDVSKCGTAWTGGATGDPLTTLTVTERKQAGLELYQITAFSDFTGVWEDVNSPASYSYSMQVDYTRGGIIFFKNKAVDVPPPPPPPGGQGCTPGYWRQEQHYDSWTSPYTPTTLFDDVFANAFPGMTLGQVVQLEGGKLNALGRHAVAALLNAASPGVAYDMTTADVITSFNNAYASGNKNTIEAAKNVFEGFNEQGCLLN